MGSMAVHNLVAGLAGFAFCLALGIVCTFYTGWVQSIYTNDRYGPHLDLFYHSFGKKLSQSRYFFWHIRTIGVMALIAAAVVLFELIRSVASLL
jgi:hypothetical protein